MEEINLNYKLDEQGRVVWADSPVNNEDVDNFDISKDNIQVFEEDEKIAFLQEVIEIDGLHNVITFLGWMGGKKFKLKTLQNLKEDYPELRDATTLLKPHLIGAGVFDWVDNSKLELIKVCWNIYKSCGRLTKDVSKEINQKRINKKENSNSNINIKDKENNKKGDENV